MGAKRVIHHRIFEVTATLILIAVVTTMRSRFMPSVDETVTNPATPLGAWLQQLQTSIPILSTWIWGIALMLAGLNIGRYGVKYSYYPAYTLMSIPLFAVVASTIMTSSDYLVTATAMIVMLLAVKYMARCTMRTGSYVDLSLSMLCFGSLPLIEAPVAVAAYAVMPVLVLFVRPAWRDWIVSVVSLIFPLAATCYIGWCCGGQYLATAHQIYDAVTTPSEFQFFRSLNLASILLMGVIIVMLLCSISLIITDRYSLKVKARAFMRFNALLGITLAALFFTPSATSSLFALIAAPIAVLLPLIFVRMGTGFTETLYRLLLIFAAANIVIMSM